MLLSQAPDCINEMGIMNFYILIFPSKEEVTFNLFMFYINIFSIKDTARYHSAVITVSNSSHKVCEREICMQVRYRTFTIKL